MDSSRRNSRLPKLLIESPEPAVSSLDAGAQPRRAGVQPKDHQTSQKREIKRRKLRRPLTAQATIIEHTRIPEFRKTAWHSRISQPWEGHKYHRFTEDALLAFGVKLG
jgi:hypothetical protein